MLTYSASLNRRSNVLEHFLSHEPGRDQPEGASTCFYFVDDHESLNTSSLMGNMIDEGLTDEEIEKREELARQGKRREEMGHVANCWKEMTSDAGWLWKRWRLGQFMESYQIRGFFISLVCLNGILLGVQVRSPVLSRSCSQ